MGDPKERKEHAEFPQVLQLLLTVHQRVWGLRKAINSPHSKGLQVAMG
jgi:hypothetical protein